MDGYSKIRLVSSTKARSMDFSDLSSTFHQFTPKPITNPTSKTQQEITSKQMKKNNTNYSFPDQEDELEANYGAERCGDGVVLRRNSSVSLASSHWFDKQKSTAIQLESAVKRAFSMRRSSSVSERYCRIHDQSVTLASSPPPLPNIDDEGTMQTRSMKKKKDKRRKILKACKRLFGL